MNLKTDKIDEMQILLLFLSIFILYLHSDNRNN